MVRNYKSEAAWEDKPEQVKRREARNKVRLRAEHSGKVHVGDSRQLDHMGFHPHGSLRSVPTKVVSAHANLSRQPPTKARGKDRSR